MKCRRCNESMTLYAVGDEYCRTCVREIAARAESDRRRNEAVRRFRFAKELDRQPAA
jgi:hypothetical protein